MGFGAKMLHEGGGASRLKRGKGGMSKREEQCGTDAVEDAKLTQEEGQKNRGRPVSRGQALDASS